MALLLYSNDLPVDPERFLDLDRALLGIAESGKLEEYAAVIPTFRKLREMERELTDEHFSRTGEPLTHLPLYTMRSLAESLYEKLAPGRREATTEIQIALMERAMNSVDLNYFAQAGRSPSLGVVEQVTRVISGVRADGILPSQFEEDIEAAAAHPDDFVGYDLVKLRDLYNIYSEYLKILGNTWIDYPGRMLRVNTELFRDRDAVFRNAFPKTRTVVIHNHSEFTWPEIDMLIQLGMVKDLNVLILFDYEEGNGPLYGNFDEVIGKLATGGYGQQPLDPIDRNVPEEQRRPFNHHMRRNLFRTDERIENSEFDQILAVYSYQNREEEVRGIAGLVKSIVEAPSLRERVAPEQICIATLNLDGYTDLFREFFPAFGIPANITSRFPLEQNGLITALFSCLNIIASNYDRRDVLRAVTSPYLSFGPNVDGAALADVSTSLRITRGYQAWRRRIGRRLDFLVGRLKSMIDPDERGSIEIELETLRRAEKSIETIHGLLGNFSSSMRPQEFRGAFLRLIARLRATENILQLRRNLNARPRTPADWQRVHDEMERDTRGMARFLGLLDELTELFESDASRMESEISSEASTEEKGEEEPLVSDSSQSEEKVSIPPEEVVPTDEKQEGAKEYRKPLSFYLDHFRTAAARSFYSIREKHEYGVLVTTLDQIQGMEFEVVIICGMVDGEFPSTYIPANFLGKPLKATEERQLRRERIAFYNGLTSFTSRLYLTYPRNAGNAELVRSSFLDALLRITTVEQSGRVIPYNELRQERIIRRQEPEYIPDRDYPAMIATLDQLAEEGGRVLWEGGTLPRVEEGGEMLENLKHTAGVEIARHQAADDPSLAQEYRGILSESLSEEERASLQARREREYSASQLETYAKCPFKFFTRRLLHVDAPASYDVTLTPLERGVLVHSVLFQLYCELREREELPITAERRDMAIDRAREIAQREIEGIHLDHPYWKIDQERLLGSPEITGLIQQWIDSEVERTSEGSTLVPQFFEVGFGQGKSGGSSGSDPLLASTNDQIEIFDVKLRGKIDRVEIVREGDLIYYAVADYKTGQPPSRKDIDMGLNLQLLLYMEVIRHILAEHFELPIENIRPVGGIYYRLNAREVETKESHLLVPNELKGEMIKGRKSKRDPDTIEQLEERMTEAFAYASSYIEGISDGRFHVTTHDVTKICRGCEYHAICRVWDTGRPEAE